MRSALAALGFLAAVLCLPQNAQAADACAAAHVRDAQRVGSGPFHYAFWHIYDAALYAPQGKYAPDRPYALKLVYRQNIKGAKIVESSLREMRKNGVRDARALAAWEAHMTRIFPDIAKGDNLTGVRTAKGAVFCQSGRQIGAVDDPAFARDFFGIWLSDKTSAPDLRRRLLGAP